MREGEAVREFHEKFGLPAPSDVGWRMKRVGLRETLINEEWDEFWEAYDSGNLADAAKEACDLIYVLHGFLIEMGIDSDRVFDEVHRSNMSKVWSDGTVKRRDDGKILKPPSYSPADVDAVLSRSVVV